MIHDKIIIALDTDSEEKARLLVEQLGDEAVFYKIGIVLFTKVGPAFIKEMKKRGKKIFFDLKFFDIPNSMALASIAGVEAGVDIINYHCLAGEESLREVQMRVAEYCVKGNYKLPLLIGVTVLTSVEGDEQTRARVLSLCHVAKNAGLAGVVCSPMEVAAIKKIYGKDFKTVVPGIRLPEGKLDDQKRAASPSIAFKNGADYIVVGRPIIQATNPKDAFQAIVQDGLNAL
ncbi:MAG: orotidine 5'-phosphate decarboxylase [Candidatus Fischerbacteria bacterium RBG_13_37_8]|uniref:Orotidine 5'-phosphate decarboxylase n=1 Tax=Candidatus Fischerbacteria bacterium RBG_13_37_8 TaxID=1817863 RepID=A0A1F5V932_9BACT|nr:MAG: orotidine 5'-phosphate decarboxylase [Candidatus Fischerbacteria bacterium RBG_13_37_8]